MSALLDNHLNQFLVFVLVLTRISGLLLAIPAFGAQTVPIKIRAFLAIGMALVVTPLFWQTAVLPPNTVLNLLIMMAREALLGLSLGLGVWILLSGVQLTGMVIGQMGGMALAGAYDPTAESQSSFFSLLLHRVTLAVFLIIGGHRVVIDALLDTFRWRPPGQGGVAEGTLQVIGEVVTQSFVLGLRAAAPMIVALLLSIILLGLISRTLPQLNILAVGFSINAIVMIGTLSVSLGAVVWVFQEQLEPTVSQILALFH